MDDLCNFIMALPGGSWEDTDKVIYNLLKSSDKVLPEEFFEKITPKQKICFKEVIMKKFKEAIEEPLLSLQILLTSNVLGGSAAIPAKIIDVIIKLRNIIKAFKEYAIVLTHVSYLGILMWSHPEGLFVRTLNNRFKFNYKIKLEFEEPEISLSQIKRRECGCLELVMPMNVECNSNSEKVELTEYHYFCDKKSLI